MAPPYVCVSDFEEEAHDILDKKVVDYYRSGAGEEVSLNLNRQAFRRLRIRPRCLRDVSSLDTTCEVLGYKLKWPVGIAPSAMQKMAHNDGEVGNATAAGEMGSIFILSTLSTIPIEEVALKTPDTCKWFQLYVYKDRSLTESLVRRVEKANFKALVLTIDSPVFGQRWTDARNKFSLPTHLQLANFQSSASDMRTTSEGGMSAVHEYVTNQFDATLTWKDVEWLVKLTHLPVVAKGVLTAEDAVLAREFGCAGVIVSNHGARHLDSIPASIEALPEVVRAVGNDITVMFDGGIRQGNDIFKALALGAKMVFVGRAALWGLACGGTAGVKEMMRVLKRDLEITMALAGCQTLNDIQRRNVVHECEYAKL
ncbi:uncharacterized protein LOC133332469 [Musca vetustissima]|uniref:uncharacterized protein LOC133332469 n=1 Tax=Musca vetustissima TaxID=27455 RepID=UPI002AB6DD00|nr:uncharacterized protein LOC133332469 [Musca vetustissima]